MVKCELCGNTITKEEIECIKKEWDYSQHPNRIGKEVHFCLTCYSIRKNSINKIERRKYNQNRKHIVLQHYSNGKPKCACCGEREPMFLTIDHIGCGRGNPAPRKNGASWNEALVKGLPEGYQVLCMNCNWSRGIHGICPHQLLKQKHSAAI